MVHLRLVCKKKRRLMSAHAVHKFIKKYDCAVRNDSERRARYDDGSPHWTHTLLNGYFGGVIDILRGLPDGATPADVVCRERLFCRAMAADAAAGKTNYVNEQRSNGLFCAYFDIDAKVRKNKPHIDLQDPVVQLSIVLCAQVAINKCFSSILIKEGVPRWKACQKRLKSRSSTLNVLLAEPNPMSFVLLATEPREFEHGVKHGIHLVFPHVLVTVGEAKVLSHVMQTEMHSYFTDAVCTDWVDHTVYDSNGLRSPWSFKRPSFCPDCAATLDKTAEEMNIEYRAAKGVGVVGLTTQDVRRTVRNMNAGWKVLNSSLCSGSNCRNGRVASDPKSAYKPRLAGGFLPLDKKTGDIRDKCVRGCLDAGKSLLLDPYRAICLSSIRAIQHESRVRASDLFGGGFAFSVPPCITFEPVMLDMRASSGDEDDKSRSTRKRRELRGMNGLWLAMQIRDTAAATIKMFVSTVNAADRYVREEVSRIATSKNINPEPWLARLTPKEKLLPSVNGKTLSGSNWEVVVSTSRRFRTLLRIVKNYEVMGTRPYRDCGIMAAYAHSPCCTVVVMLDSTFCPVACREHNMGKNVAFIFRATHVTPICHSGSNNVRAATGEKCFNHRMKVFNSQKHGSIPLAPKDMKRLFRIEKSRDAEAIVRCGSIRNRDVLRELRKVSNSAASHVLRPLESFRPTKRACARPELDDADVAALFDSDEEKEIAEAYSTKVEEEDDDDDDDTMHGFSDSLSRSKSVCDSVGSLSSAPASQTHFNDILAMARGKIWK